MVPLELFKRIAHKGHTRTVWLLGAEKQTSWKTSKGFIVDLVRKKSAKVSLTGKHR